MRSGCRAARHTTRVHLSFAATPSRITAHPSRWFGVGSRLSSTVTTCYVASGLNDNVSLSHSTAHGLCVERRCSDSVAWLCTKATGATEPAVCASHLCAVDKMNSTQTMSQPVPPHRMSSQCLGQVHGQVQRFQDTSMARPYRCRVGINRHTPV